MMNYDASCMLAYITSGLGLTKYQALIRFAQSVHRESCKMPLNNELVIVSFYPFTRNMYFL
jgi:hypothetical protein